MAQYFFLGTRVVGTNGTSTRVFEKNLYFNNITKNKGFLSDVKMDVGCVPFFDNWHLDRPFLSLAVRKKSSNFTHTLM